MKTCSTVVLINENGLILGVSRKDDHNDINFCGGKSEPIDDNDPINTAIRETKEETGLDIFNLRLIFATNYQGAMNYTYLADYNGEINHNEPHVVKFVDSTTIKNGRFGDYNELVFKSLDEINIKYRKYPLPTKEYLFCVVEKENIGNMVCFTTEEYMKGFNPAIDLPNHPNDDEYNDIQYMLSEAKLNRGIMENFYYSICNENLKIIDDRLSLMFVLEQAGFKYNYEFEFLM